MTSGVIIHHPLDVGTNIGGESHAINGVEKDCFIHDYKDAMSLSSFDTVLLLLALFYCLTIAGLLTGLYRLRKRNSAEKPLVSVIVAARNEEQNVERLLSALANQDYPEFEIVIANDRSEDRTKSLVEAWQEKERRIRLLNITASAQGMPAKKNALSAAILASRGSILCFTDADCHPPPAWVSELVRQFEPSVGLVVGYSPYRGSTAPNQRSFVAEVLSRFIRFEEFKAALWSAGSIGLKKGWLCTGRNLAYRKTVFDAVGGFEKIRMSISGDDDLFLQLVRRETNWEVTYVTSPESQVPTAPPQSFSQFIEQRKRHFSAAKHFPFSMKVFFALFHLTNLIIFGAFISWLVVPGLSQTILAVFAAKTVTDGALLFAGSRLLGEKNLRPSFVLLEILYVLYNTFVGPLGLIQTFEWKPQAK
jgi:cellulose synthase/poly-beta-1,6-N-acetylglucosamine synthase-like glycosyltransferase